MRFRLLLIWLLLAIIATAKSVLAQNLLLPFVDLHNLDAARVKRQVDDDGGRCLFECIDKMRAGMGRLGLSQSQQSAFMQMPVLTNQTIRDYCNIYREGKECINDCPSTQHSDAVQIGFAGSDYMCVQKLDEFIEYLTCYKRAEGRIKTYCDAGCEGGQNDFAELHQNTVRARTEQNLQSSLVAMNEACRLIGCQLSCQAPVIVEYCNNNQKAAELLEQFAARSWKAMRRIHIRQQNLASNPMPFPKHCEAVADGDFQKLAPVQQAIEQHIDNDKHISMDKNEMDNASDPKFNAAGTGLTPSQVLQVSNIDNNWYKRTPVVSFTPTKYYCNYFVSILIPLLLLCYVAT